MTKILIEIDTDIQRVVPIEPTQEMIDAMPPVEEIGYWAMYESAIAAAPQPEPVDVDLRRKYEELLMTVARKFPNESRHETVLRYIRQMEEPKTTAAKLAMAQGE